MSKTTLSRFVLSDTLSFGVKRVWVSREIGPKRLQRQSQGGRGKIMDAVPTRKSLRSAGRRRNARLAGSLASCAGSWRAGQSASAQRAVRLAIGSPWLGFGASRRNSVLGRNRFSSISRKPILRTCSESGSHFVELISQIRLVSMPRGCLHRRYAGGGRGGGGGGVGVGGGGGGGVGWGGGGEAGAEAGVGGGRP